MSLEVCCEHMANDCPWTGPLKDLEVLYLCVQVGASITVELYKSA